MIRFRLKSTIPLFFPNQFLIPAVGVGRHLLDKVNVLLISAAVVTEVSQGEEGGDVMENKEAVYVAAAGRGEE